MWGQAFSRAAGLLPGARPFYDNPPRRAEARRQAESPAPQYNRVYMRIGVDAGGTFTDFVVLHDDGRLETFKLRSNPAAPAEVILAGLEQAASGVKTKVEVVHGSTVATNALLERKGARTAFVTTAGFEDLLEIGRQNRAELYNLTPDPRRLLVPRALCFGIGERTLYDGSVARKPTGAELVKLSAKLRRTGVRAIAICFLHAYQNASNGERCSARWRRPGCTSARRTTSAPSSVNTNEPRQPRSTRTLAR